MKLTVEQGFRIKDALDDWLEAYEGAEITFARGPGVFAVAMGTNVIVKVEGVEQGVSNAPRQRRRRSR